MTKRRNTLLQVYPISSLEFSKAKGSYLFDKDERRYVDFFSGYAVTSLGHASKVVEKAIKDQLKTGLIMTNAYDFEITSTIELSNKLCDNTFGDNVFFGNSGTESMELCVKLVKKYFHVRHPGQSREPNIISFKNAFHGRTNGSIALSDLPKLYSGFEPLMPNTRFADFNDIESVKKLIDENTCGIILEPVQGQGGLKIMDKKFAKELRKICTDHDIPLVFDEVQTGNSRTGKLYAYMHFDIEPDIMATAKGIGGGFPISACIMKKKYADAMGVGSHGTTFGGGPLATNVALNVFNEISSQKILGNVNRVGKFIVSELKKIQKKRPDVIVKIDGIGLMIATFIDVKYVNGDIIDKLIKNGLVVTGGGGNMVRFLPPLNVSRSTAKEGLEIFEKVICGL